jgi:hypothetical protein
MDGTGNLEPTKERGDPTLFADCRTIFAHDEAAIALAQEGGILQVKQHWRTLQQSKDKGCRFCMYLFAMCHMEYPLPEIGELDVVEFEFRNIGGWDHIDWQVTVRSAKFPGDQMAFFQVSAHKGWYVYLHGLLRY